MINQHLKLWLGLLAVTVAVIVVVTDPTVAQGTGLIVATLAAGAGWLFRDANDEARSLRNICQAYASLIESQFDEIRWTLSDEELDRFLKLAPKIADGTEAPSFAKRTADPFATLPDIRSHLHLLSPETITLLSKWQVRANDLFCFYDELGGRQLSSISQQRLAAYFDHVRTYRDIGYSAMQQLKREIPGLNVNLTVFENAGARTHQQS